MPGGFASVNAGHPMAPQQQLPQQSCWGTPLPAQQQQQQQQPQQQQSVWGQPQQLQQQQHQFQQQQHQQQQSAASSSNPWAAAAPDFPPPQPPPPQGPPAAPVGGMEQQQQQQQQMVPAAAQGAGHGSGQAPNEHPIVACLEEITFFLDDMGKDQLWLLKAAHTLKVQLLSYYTLGIVF